MPLKKSDLLEKIFADNKKFLPEIDHFREPVKDLLDMVCDDENHARAFISNTFVYLHNLYQYDPTYNGFFKNLEPTLENFIAAYYTVRPLEFLHAWTYSMAVFNYTEAIRNEKRKQEEEISYIG